MKYDPQVYGRRVGYYPTSEVFKSVDRSVYPLDRPSDAEFERRHKVIRKFMENKGLDCLIIQSGAGGSAWQNVRWVTNCLPPEAAYLIIPAKGEMTLLLYFQNLVDPFRRAQMIIEDVRSGNPGRDFGRIITERIKELGYARGNTGIVEVAAGSMPPNHLKQFSAELPNAQFEFVTDDWWKQVRLIKSNEELKFLEKSAAIGDKIVEAIAENARPGVTEAEIFACAYNALFKHGGEIGMPLLLINTTNTFKPTTGLHFSRPQNRVLQKGDIIHQEMRPVYCDGSTTLTGKPIALGEPSDEYMEMIELMMEVYNRETELLRPGKTNEDITKAAAPIIEAGYSGVCPVTWGMPGRGANEYPCALVFDDPASHKPEPFVLEPGMTPSLQIMPISLDFTKGVEIHDTWVITEGEPRCLNKYPRQLTIV